MRERISQSKTVDKIIAFYKEEGDKGGRSRSIGASSIGHSCDRYLWLAFRHADTRDISGRIYRLFATGNLEEDRMVTDLRAIGYEVHDVGEDGKQFKVTALGGHVKGYMDGCVRGLPEDPEQWHVLECKTHNAKSFVKLVKDGVEASKPIHYAQIQLYMLLTGMQLGLYIAKNKDTDELYTERIALNENYAKGLLERAKRIITSSQPPARISDKPEYYECRYCDTRHVCHNTGISSVLPVEIISCRQCCHSSAETDGIARWSCVKKKKTLSLEDQNKACADHLVLPGMIPFASPVKGTQDSIEFQDHDNMTTWLHGKDGWSTKELRGLRKEDLSGGIVEALKSKYSPGEIEVGRDILTELGDTAVKTWEGHRTGLAAQWEKRYGIKLDTEEIVDETKTDRHVLNLGNGRLAVADENIGQIWEVKA